MMSFFRLYWPRFEDRWRMTSAITEMFSSARWLVGSSMAIQGISGAKRAVGRQAEGKTEDDTLAATGLADRAGELVGVLQDEVQLVVDPEAEGLVEVETRDDFIHGVAEFLRLRLHDDLREGLEVASTLPVAPPPYRRGQRHGARQNTSPASECPHVSRATGAA